MINDRIAAVTIQPVPPAGDCALDILRLDRFDPVISGNKWFKLRYYLAEASGPPLKQIVTFGGAWSNHIVAAAYACKEAGIPATGIIRGEEPANWSATLQAAAAAGMQLRFLPRSEYTRLNQTLVSDEHTCVIPAGGYGTKGMEGAATIADLFDPHLYTHICCAAGTGTMAAGLATRLQANQTLAVIPVLRHTGIEQDIRRLCGPTACKLVVLPDFHGGGYAKISDDLLAFMNDWYRQTGIATDFVYTGKLFRAVVQLKDDGFFPAGSRILVVHSGGLQGNASLPKGSLIF